MAAVHAIRLRGPWELEPLERWTLTSDGQRISSADALPAAGRWEMPADWSALLGPGFSGRVRHRRNFNRPSGIVPGKRVWLVCEGATQRANVALNGTQLGEIRGPDAPARFDITDRLALRCELTIDVEFEELPPGASQGSSPVPAASPRGLTGEVRLEIEE